MTKYGPVRKGDEISDAVSQALGNREVDDTCFHAIKYTAEYVASLDKLLKLADIFFNPKVRKALEAHKDLHSYHDAVMAIRHAVVKSDGLSPVLTAAESLSHPDVIKAVNDMDFEDGYPYPTRTGTHLLLSYADTHMMSSPETVASLARLLSEYIHIHDRPRLTGYSHLVQELSGTVIHHPADEVLFVVDSFMRHDVRRLLKYHDGENMSGGTGCGTSITINDVFEGIVFAITHVGEYTPSAMDPSVRMLRAVHDTELGSRPGYMLGCMAFKTRDAEAVTSAANTVRRNPRSSVVQEFSSIAEGGYRRSGKERTAYVTKNVKAVAQNHP